MFLWCFIGYMYVAYSWIHMSQNLPQHSWQILSSNLKNRARNWFIKRAEIAGIPWIESSSYYLEKNTFNRIQSLKYKIENDSIEYPQYYLQPFHGYENGNLEWKAAIEGEAATYSISANYWKNISYLDAEKWLRYNMTSSIKSYLKHERIEHSKLKRILDIGCSIGISTEFLRKSFPKASIYGLDLSAYFLAVACYRKNIQNNNIMYVHANAEKIPMVDESMDMVTINFMLHEVPFQARINIFREIFRILKPNGILAILDLDLDRIQGHLQFNPFRKWAFEITEPHIYNYYNHDMIESLYNSGFEHVGFYKNDPVNKLWICQKSTLKIQTAHVIKPKTIFAYATI